MRVFACAAVVYAAVRLGGPADAASASGAAGIALVRQMCPSTLLLERHDANDYVIVFDAPRRSIASFRVRVYAPGGDGIADLPAVAVSTPYASAGGTRFRSRAFDLRPPGGAPLSAATVRATFAGATKTCPSEDRLISAANVASSTAVAARNDGFAREAITSAPITFRPARTTRFSCSQPFAPAAAVHAVTPDYPKDADGATGYVWIGVHLGVANDATTFTTIRSSGSYPLDRAALLAARASTYASEIIGCRPHAGSYIFVSTFDGQ